MVGTLVNAKVLTAAPACLPHEFRIENLKIRCESIVMFDEQIHSAGEIDRAFESIPDAFQGGPNSVGVLITEQQALVADAGESIVGNFRKIVFETLNFSMEIMDE